MIVDRDPGDDRHPPPAAHPVVGGGADLDHLLDDLDVWHLGILVR
jgi:hypothetical protein